MLQQPVPKLVPTARMVCVMMVDRVHGIPIVTWAQTVRIVPPLALRAVVCFRLHGILRYPHRHRPRRRRGPVRTRLALATSGEARCGAGQQRAAGHQESALVHHLHPLEKDVFLIINIENYVSIITKNKQSF